MFKKFINMTYLFFLFFFPLDEIGIKPSSSSVLLVVAYSEFSNYYTSDSGILRDNTMADKLMYIPMITHRKDTQLDEPTNKNSMKFPKVVNLTNKKTLL